MNYDEKIIDDFLDYLLTKDKTPEEKSVEEDDDDYVDYNNFTTEDWLYELDELQAENFELREALDTRDILDAGNEIKRINYCDEPGKEKVIVVFRDRTKIIKTPCEGDNFDLNVGVALAVMEKLYGSKSKFHNMIKSKLPENKK